MSMTEFFIVEHEDGEPISAFSEHDFTVFNTREEARDAADDNRDDDSVPMKIVRFVRESEEVW